MMKCRHCKTTLKSNFLNLGFSPPSNSYLNQSDLTKVEKYYPLSVMVCEKCWLVQTEDYAQAEEFFNSEYAYFSSTSTSWLKHAKLYVEKVTKELSLTPQSFVIEVASNDGYLLRNFVAEGIPCLGIEPTDSTAKAAEELGIEVIRKFFGENFAKELAANGRQADLIIGNNVYAHVPDINDFTRGLKTALKTNGVVTLEFPHLMRLLDDVQFDTVYHEHFSYLSLCTVDLIFRSCGLRVYDVENHESHGGSLRVYGCHIEDPRSIMPSVKLVKEEELSKGLRILEGYSEFQIKADNVKNDLLEFLIRQKKSGKIVAAYGAAAKGNTMLNYAGVKPDLLAFVCDAAAAKQNKYMPGSHIPILHPSMLLENKIDYLLILPWNLAKEVIEQNKFLRERGVKFVTAVPSLQVLE